MRLKQKELYYLRKKQGLCVKCGKTVEISRKDKVLCIACAEKSNIYNRKYYNGGCDKDCDNCIFEDCIIDTKKLYERYKKKYEKRCEQQKEYKRKLYLLRKNQGLCVKCGKPLENEKINKCFCSKHRILSIKSSRLYRRKNI